ncbi:hypothetical protein [Leptolyngbya sp. FACHB-16]|nr:hypothetical protein [Leptolyngbya sp. FACHB-16]MBD1911670.1 hypothetical protein [Leptolyngbya sp. FACHB-8]MBD2154591.1 hypothetical protein [Leptolyngbya sp. FACHB-16]
MPQTITLVSLEEQAIATASKWISQSVLGVRDVVLSANSKVNNLNSG